MFSLSMLAAIVGVVLSTPVVAQSHEDTGALAVRLDARVGRPGIQTRAVTLIFTDGLVTRDIRTSRFSRSESVLQWRLLASQDAMADLLRALGEIDPEHLTEICRPPFSSGTDTWITTQVTTFERGELDGIFTVQEEPGRLESDCPSDLEEAFGAIDSALQTALLGQANSVLEPVIGRTSSGRLLLHEGRFEVEVDWRAAPDRTGAGLVVPSPARDSGLFAFFDLANWEVLVKVLDGCATNGHYWVYIAGASDVGYTVRVREPAAGRSREFENPLGSFSPLVADTTSFPCDPGGVPALATLRGGASAATTGNTDPLAEATRLVLQVDEVRHRSELPRARPERRSLHVYRDGLLLEERKDPATGSTLLRSSAVPDALLAELEISDAASVRGDCRASLEPSEGESPVETTIVWFSEQASSGLFDGNAFSVSNSSPVSCPEATLAIVEAIGAFVEEARGAPEAETAILSAPDPAAADVLLLQDGRFAVTADRLDAQEREIPARVAAEASDQSALFWFFHPLNWEIFLKVLDGCAHNGHYWVFGAAATDLPYLVRVEDRSTGERWQLATTPATASSAFGDVLALPCSAPMIP